MPQIGYGTFNIHEVQQVYDAIAMGYRLIDTASMYKNAETVGQAIKKAIADGVVTRDELFVVTKIWGDEKRDVEGALQKQLDLMQLEYVDLYLIHWPVAFKTDENGKNIRDKIPLYKTWAEMEKLVDIGKTKHIGVSNFNVQLINDLLTYCKIIPAVNEVELHPYLPQIELVRFLKEEGIIPIAYCPLARAG